MKIRIFLEAPLALEEALSDLGDDLRDGGYDEEHAEAELEKAKAFFERFIYEPPARQGFRACVTLEFDLEAQTVKAVEQER